MAEIENATDRPVQAISSRLKTLATQMANRAITDPWMTRDEFFSGLNSFLWEFFVSLRDPLTSVFQVTPGQRLTRTQFSDLSNRILGDIQNGYDRIQDTRNETLRRVNRCLASLRALQGQVSKAGNLVHSISLGSDKDTYEIGDGFTNTLLVDSSTLTTHSNLGLVTLPLDYVETVSIHKVEVLANSNGVVVKEYTPDKMIDQNGATWFQYERPVDALDDDILSCSLYVTLDTLRVINCIQLDPVIFDDMTFPRILDIQTSVDGIVFRSVLEDLPAKLSFSDREAITTLGPVGIRNQSTAEFIFTPRVTQFIKVRLEQSRKIETSVGFLQRLGISELRVQAQHYKDSGTLMTRALPLPFSGRRFRLETYDTETAPLTNFSWQLSLNQGINWLDLVPYQVLDLSNIDNLPKELNSVYLRVIASRDKTRFTGVSRPLAASTKRVTERKTIPGTPASVQLQDVPVSDSVEVLQPLFPVGLGYGTKLTDNTNQATTSGLPAQTLTINLPVAIPELRETVRVNGELWRRVTFLSGCQPDDRVYAIDYVNKKISFGDDQQGRAPVGAITLELLPESVQVPDGSLFAFNLEYAHDYNSQRIDVRWYDRPRRSETEVLTFSTKSAVSGTIQQFATKFFPILPLMPVVEDIPRNTTGFWLQGIPKTLTDIVFSDRIVFANRVSGTPAVPGDYSLEFLDSSVVYNPVLVTSYLPTNITIPTTVKYDSRAAIRRIQTSYEANSWETNLENLGVDEILEVFEPQFGDQSVFQNEKSFVNGHEELIKTGDYCLNYTTGQIYSFGTPNNTLANNIRYVYQINRPLNWSFGATSKELILTDEKTFVAQNDQTPVVLNKPIYTSSTFYSRIAPSVVVQKEGTYFFVPTTESSPFTPFDPAVGKNGSYSTPFSFTQDDLVRGWCLPAGSTRVHLPHRSIMCNSIRFLFLSDDQGAFNDRMIYANVSGEQDTAPYWIRDIYGNQLVEISSSLKTQRDIDRQALQRERTYQNGVDELEQDGDYSVDYKNGALFTVTPIPAHTIIQYKFTDIRVSYQAMNPLILGTDFLISPDTASLIIQSLLPHAPSEDLLLKYEVVDQLQEDPSVIYSLYSPLLMGWKLCVKGI